MKAKLFINLPVKNLDHSKEFFGELGYEFDGRFSGEHTACMAIEEHIYVMLVAEDFFKRFTKKDVIDAHRYTEHALRIPMKSRKNVNTWAKKALAIGATENTIPDLQRDGVIYGRSLNDLDGHIWEVVWTSPDAARKRARRKRRAEEKRGDRNENIEWR